MKRKRLGGLVLAVVLSLAGLPPAAPGQQPQQAAPPAEPQLAAGSKKAILETGISERYFDKHFRLARVVAEEGERRVEWKLSVGEYEVLLVDDIGYHTSQSGERVDVHSIRNELFSARDIKRTIRRGRAEAALKSCIGEHTGAAVVYRALRAPGKARLYLTARAKVELGAKREEGRREEGGPGGEIEGLSFNVGFVDLESGKCTVEKGQVTP